MNIFLTLALAGSLFSCKPDAPVEKPDPEDPNKEEPAPQPEDPVIAITSLSLAEYPSARVSIDEDGSSVAIVLPYGSKLGSATLNIELSEGLVSSPANGAKVDLSKSFNLFVTHESGASKKYKVSSTLAKSNQTGFKWVTANDYLIRGERNGSEISFTFPYGTDLTKLSFTVPSDNALSFDPDITSTVDISQPLKVKFYAEDGETYDEYTLSASLFPKDTGIRGIYLPSPSHTSSFANYENLCASMDLLAELNFNCLFVCAWASTKTAWESEVLMANTNYQQASACNMYRSYTGGSGDAIADMISEGHKRGIKIILWFEYGFMHRVGGVDHLDPLLAKHPTWIGINSEGGYSNYNGNDFYLNAFDPAVQQFMIDMMCEAVRKYPDLDGVQGDDRLPAMPRNSGYNEVTKTQYQLETGRVVPSDYEDSDWVRWRRDNLNAFALTLRKAVKKVNEDCIVCFAPNKYPWADGVLFQDWPSWMRNGAADFVNIQCYVTANYENDVKSQVNYMNQVSSRMVFLPAMILKNGAAILPEQLISDELCYNRKVGTFGEAQFWFDGLLNPEVKKMFSLFYSYPIEFPKF